VEVGICRIRRLKEKLGIWCKQERKFRATKDSKQAFPVGENMLNEEFEATGPNEYGAVTLRIFPRKKAGSIWLVTRIFSQEKSQDMPWVIETQRI